MTVLGPVASDQLGVVLPHEHVFIDLVKVLPNFDFQLIDPDLVTREVARFRAAGGGTLVEVTTDRAMGRDPEGLRRVAAATGLHIVMGCGWYREPWYDRERIRRATANELSECLVHEIERGFEGTGVRPGIIGEIGADQDYVSPAEERVLRAAARAHHRTGLTITLHARASQVGAQQLDILEEERVDPRRVIVGHCDTYPYPEYHVALAKRGAWVQFDTVRGVHEYVVERRLAFVLEMARHRLLHRVLLSQDICALSHLHAFGGTGYDYVLTGFVPRLRQAGLTDEDIHMLLVENPRRALVGEA